MAIDLNNIMTNLNQEAFRCLLCPKPKCSQACPVETPVPEAMKLYREGKYTEAAEILFYNNPFTSITSQVCDWQKFCFGHCVLNAKKVPVHWHEIEQELSMEYLFHADVKVETPDNGRKAAIVGAGPAGITAAIMLGRKGFSVTIYDSFDKIGGVLRYGIPAFRLDKKYVDAYERILDALGVRFVGNTHVGKDIMLDELRAANDAVIIAAGAWVPRKLDIPGEDGDGVIYALEYLKEPEAFDLGSKVLVIGGGNVTMDASRTAKRRGYDTTVVYRKTFENMPAGYIEVEGAKKDGVGFMVFEVPVAIRRENGRRFAVLRSCENYNREDGSIATRIIDGSDHEVEFDSMIVAISEKVDHSILGGAAPEDMPDVFFAGDYAYGPATVVEAVASAKEVVGRIINGL